MNSIEKVVELLKKSSSASAEEHHHKHSKSDATGKSIAKDKAANKTLELNLDNLQAQGFITPYGLNTVKADEFRIIKRPILRKAFDKSKVAVANGNMIMVTSSLPGEGKTFSSLNLAISIALELDKTVLLVDSDVLNPALSRLLEIDNYVGLTELLMNENLNARDVIFNTNIPRLRILPSGGRYPESNELLTSSRMVEFTKELSERYHDRIVIFDTPPLLLANQARVLSQLMGQIVVVIEAEKTAQRVVKDSIELLDTDKPIGIILNKTRKIGNGNYYGSYGPYGSYYPAGEK